MSRGKNVSNTFVISSIVEQVFVARTLVDTGSGAYALVSDHFARQASDHNSIQPNPPARELIYSSFSCCQFSTLSGELITLIRAALHDARRKVSTCR